MKKVWAYIALITFGAAVAWVIALSTPPPIVRPIEIPWWLLIAAVAIGESAVIHLRFRQDAHSFSLSEIVLVGGLFLAPPSTILLAYVIGNGISLAAGRRQVLVRFAFNMAQLLFIAGLSVVAFGLIIDAADPLGPSGWLAALAIPVFGILLQELAINVVIHLTGSKMALSEMLEAMSIGVVGAALNGTLGLIAAFLVWNDLRASWLALVPPMLMYIAYRTHAAQREHSERLESIQAVTEAIHTAPDMPRALLAAAESARTLVSATWLEIVVFPEGRDEPMRTLAGVDGTRESMAVVELSDELPSWWMTVAGLGDSVVVSGPSSSALGGSPPIQKDVIVVPIIGAKRHHGYVLAADRLGDVSTFEAGDTQLLATVANQVSVSLDNGRLELSLAAVTDLKEKLEVMVDSKDQFIASVSHELRTPLTSVVGLAEEIENNLGLLEPADLKEFIGIIVDQSTELSFIIEDLLVAARADIGTLAVVPEVVDIDAEVRTLIATTLSLSRDTDLLSGRCPPAWVDPIRFRQVVRNLLTNARRYGGPNILIESGSRGGRGFVTVSDDGPGVPADRAEAIFEPYERAHSEPSQPGSVGLGLAVARQLARLMDGDLTYERAGGRSRFTVWFPLASVRSGHRA